MSERLLDHDSSTGLRTWFSTDDDGDTWRVRYEQDVSSSLDACKEAQAESWDRREDMWHAAHIPAVILMEWKTKHGVEAWNPNHKDGVRRLLDDPDYRYLRVRHFYMGKH